jgi:hypothetical protein
MPVMKVKEGTRRTSIALALVALVLAAVGGCGDSARRIIYDDSLLGGTETQACAPDGGHFDLHIVDRTTYLVANPSIPTFDMAAKPGTSIVGFAFVMRSPRQDSGVLQVFPDAGVFFYDIMNTEIYTDAGRWLPPRQRVQTVRFFGVSVAHQANMIRRSFGTRWPSVDGCRPAFWFQNDAAISYRIGNTGTEQVGAALAAHGQPPLRPPTTGRWWLLPALLFQGNSAVLATATATSDSRPAWATGSRPIWRWPPAGRPPGPGWPGSRPATASGPTVPTTASSTGRRRSTAEPGLRR